MSAARVCARLSRPRLHMLKPRRFDVRKIIHSRNGAARGGGNYYAFSSYCLLPIAYCLFLLRKVEEAARTQINCMQYELHSLTIRRFRFSARALAPFPPEKTRKQRKETENNILRSKNSLFIRSTSCNLSRENRQSNQLSLMIERRGEKKVLEEKKHTMHQQRQQWQKQQRRLSALTKAKRNQQRATKKMSLSLMFIIVSD